MIFCNNCFKDQEIKSIIEKTGCNGTCPICGSTNAYIYDTEKNDILTGKFDNLLSTYTPKQFIDASNIPKEKIRPISEAIKEDWDIFSDKLSAQDITNILKYLSPETFNFNPELFSDDVVIPAMYNVEYLKEHCILRTYNWEDFVETIKGKNRFHSDLINKNVLKEYCLGIAKEIKVSDKKIFYRARISPTAQGFTPSRMGAPPQEKSTNGRTNSRGISRLYLTNKRTTTFHEVRAAEYDYITIGNFKPIRDLKVVDFKRICNPNLFADDADCTTIAINKEHLNKISKEMSKTMRRNDSDLDYLPTQYIADFIMSITDDDGNPIFDGIEYQSAMNDDSSNLVIFYPDLFKCKLCRTYEINKVKYSYKLTK